MVSLQRIASFPDDLEAAIQAPEIRGWQREEFEDSLREVVAQQSPS
jgi:hypothetical protein